MSTTRSQPGTPCPYNADCARPDECQERKGCVLRPMSDWRANPYPYPLRSDSGTRAVWPAAGHELDAAARP